MDVTAETEHLSRNVNPSTARGSSPRRYLFCLADRKSQILKSITGAPVFKFSRPNQASYLALGLIALFKKRSAPGKFIRCRMTICNILNGPPLNLLAHRCALYNSGAAVNVDDDHIKIAARRLI